MTRGAIDKVGLAGLLRDQALQRPDAHAILGPARKPLSYKALWNHVQAVGATLRRHGAKPSTRVAVALPNGPELATSILGTAAYAACVPLNPNLRWPETRAWLIDTSTQIVLLLKGEMSPAREAANELGLQVLDVELLPGSPAGQFALAAQTPTYMPVEPSGAEDEAVVVQTAGTTSRSKTIALTHAGLLLAAGRFVRHLALTAADRCLNVMPLFHSHGLRAALFGSLACGGSVVCASGFDDEAFFDWIAEFEPTWYTAVPAIHMGVIAAARRRPGRIEHRLRFIRSTSAPLAPTVARQLEECLGAPVIESYGMTERSMMTINPLPPARRKPGSVGLPVDVEISIVAEDGTKLPSGVDGEIVVRTPEGIAGFERCVASDASRFIGGWFRTGDQGRLDEHGFLYVTGRLSEVINRGGQKISPREVDDALLEHPDVIEAASFGIPHPSLGQDVVAAVVLREGSNADSLVLREYLFERLSMQKVPSQVVITDVIPKSSTGKVRRQALHDALAHRFVGSYIDLQTQTENIIAMIVRDVLGCAAVGACDNFFALGGDSLHAVRVIARITAQFGIRLPIAALFRYPQVRLLAAEVDAARGAAEVRIRELFAEVAAMSDEEVARLLALEGTSHERPDRHA